MKVEGLLGAVSAWRQALDCLQAALEPSCRKPVGRLTEGAGSREPQVVRCLRPELATHRVVRHPLHLFAEAAAFAAL